MKAMRDAAGLLILILMLFSVRLAPPAGQSVDWIPAAQAATEPTGDSIANLPAAEAPPIGALDADRCAPSIFTLRDAGGQERLVIVRVERSDRECSDAPREPRPLRAGQIG